MRYLNKYNENLKKVPTTPNDLYSEEDILAFDEITNYKSDTISNIEIDNFSSDYYWVELYITFSNGIINKLIITKGFYYGEFKSYKMSLESKFLGSGSGIVGKIISSLSRYQEYFKYIEDIFNRKMTQNKNLLIRDEMFNVITKELLDEYFAELTDYHKYTIDPFMHFSEKIFWRIGINTNINLSIINDDTINVIDSLISSYKRLKEIYDITMNYKYEHQVGYNILVISIFANSEEGDPIGYSFYKNE